MTDSNKMMRFETDKKSEGVALVLCWMLGVWGAHRFYLNKPHAVTMLAITLNSVPLCLVGIGFVSLAAMIVRSLIDVFSVTKWVKEHNTALRQRIEAT